MTNEFSIELPKVRNDEIKKPVSIKAEKNEKFPIFNFDKDKSGDLDATELKEAMGYFVQKEKEIAKSGEKGDNILTNADLAEIIRTDDKFKDLRKDKNGVNKLFELLKSVVTAYSTIEDKDTKKVFGSLNQIKAKTKSSYGHIAGCPTLITDSKTVDGEKINICTKGNMTYVTDANGKKITNPNDAAKYLGYKTESTLMGLGPNKYYVETSKRGHLNEKHDISEKSRQYMVWDEKSCSFIPGEIKSTGETIHHL